MNVWLRWAGWALTPVLILSCRSAGVRTPVTRLSDREQILVETGDSAQASYSPRGDQLVFVSGKRPGHAHQQVYVRESNGVERRLTFSNGAVQHPSFHPREALIVYASSTDELKEYSPLLKVGDKPETSRRPASLSAPLDIYVHGLNSYEIDRLTVHEGFDGLARFADDGRAVTWTQSVGDRTRVQSISRANRATRVLQGLGLNPTDYVIAPDLTASAWIEYDADFGAPKLRLRRDKQTREIASDRPAAKYDLNFTPDSRWLLWSEFDPATQTYAPMSLEIETGCVRPFQFSEKGGSRRDPTLSPDGQWLTYTLIGRDKSRIARSPFDPRPGPCATQP